MSKDRTNTEKLYDVIKKPIITEKSVGATSLGQYTFEVQKDASKIEIAQAVELAFPGRKVKKVRTVYMPSHSKRMGYKFGRTDSSKKAIVTIEGDPIEELVGAQRILGRAPCERQRTQPSEDKSEWQCNEMSGLSE